MPRYARTIAYIVTARGANNCFIGPYTCATAREAIDLHEHFKRTLPEAAVFVVERVKTQHDRVITAQDLLNAGEQETAQVVA